MENNATYNHVIGELKSQARLWKKVGDNLENISLSKTRLGNYGIFYTLIYIMCNVKNEIINYNNKKERNFFNG